MTRIHVETEQAGALWLAAAWIEGLELEAQRAIGRGEADAITAALDLLAPQIRGRLGANEID